jgi:nitrous oxide reductase
MSIGYIKNCIKFVLSQCKSDEWIYQYLFFINQGLDKFSEKKKLNHSFQYSFTFLEKDSSFLKYFLDDQIKKYNEKNIPIIQHQLEQFQNILKYLKENIQNVFVKEWVEELFPHKNNTKCLDSDWHMPFDKYLSKDQIDFFLENDSPKQIKQYLFFIETMEDIIFKEINIFDPNNFIFIAKFENMLIKICHHFHHIKISKTDLAKIKIKSMANIL